MSEGVVQEVEQVKNILCRLKDQRIVLRVGKISNKGAQYMFNLESQESVDEKPPNTEGGPSCENEEHLNYDALHIRLEQIVERKTANASPIARCLLGWLENGRRYFTVKELCNGLEVSWQQTRKTIQYFRDKKIVRTAETLSDRTVLYMFNLAVQGSVEEKPPNPEQDNLQGAGARRENGKPGWIVDESLNVDGQHFKGEERSERTVAYRVPLIKRPMPVA